MGKHSILRRRSTICIKRFQGPSNPDVFEPYVDDERKNISEEVVKESKLIQGEILVLLNKVRLNINKLFNKLNKHLTQISIYIFY